MDTLLRRLGRKVREEFRCRLNARNKQPVARKGAGDVEQFALGIVNLIEFSFVGDGFNAPLQGQAIVIARHDGDGFLFEALGKMHGADGYAALRLLKALGHAREDYFMRGVLAHRRHARHFPGRIDRGDLGFGREVERDSHDVGIFGIEQPFGIQIIGIAAEAAPDDLLAQKLRTESPNAENMGDGVGVSAFGQHGDGDDAAHLLAKPPSLADRVHDLAQQVGVGEFTDFARAQALRDLALVLLDLEGGGAAEVVVERFARFELLAVDQHRVGTGEAVSVLVELPNSERWPWWTVRSSSLSSATGRCQPEIHSWTSFDVDVLLQTTMMRIGRSKKGLASVTGYLCLCFTLMV
jgi:hypothetical protein